ncbi:MAG TPA: hypothetical protein VF767_08140 [Bryobacteraceae bacterium]
MRTRLGIEATILLSIRHAALRSQIHQFLHGLGLHVVEAPGGDDPACLTPEACRRIDLWLTDRAVQPEMAATREVLRHCPGVTVLALSGDTRRASRAASTQVRVSFIETPFAWCELEERIAELLIARLRARATGWGGPEAASIVIVTALPPACTAGATGC